MVGRKIHARLARNRSATIRVRRKLGRRRRQKPILLRLPEQRHHHKRSASASVKGLGRNRLHKPSWRSRISSRWNHDRRCSSIQTPVTCVSPHKRSSRQVSKGFSFLSQWLVQRTSRRRRRHRMPHRTIDRQHIRLHLRLSNRKRNLLPKPSCLQNLRPVT